MITLYVRQQGRHRCIEQSFGLCGRGRGWDDLKEWHWNIYNIICEMNRQSRFDAWYRMVGAGALGWPRGMVWGERWKGSSGWGTHVYPWWIHVDILQNQYNTVWIVCQCKLQKRNYSLWSTDSGVAFSLLYPLSLCYGSFKIWIGLKLLQLQEWGLINTSQGSESHRQMSHVG